MIKHQVDHPHYNEFPWLFTFDVAAKFGYKQTWVTVTPDKVHLERVVRFHMTHCLPQPSAGKSALGRFPPFVTVRDFPALVP
jgi:hypothetical protein